jgi:hypothetical protein
MAFRATVNVTLVREISADLDSAATITTTTTAVPVPGVKVDQLYLVAFADADLDAGLLMQGVVLCEADNVLNVRVVNPTIGSINVAAANLTVIGL